MGWWLCIDCILSEKLSQLLTQWGQVGNFPHISYVCGGYMVYSMTPFSSVCFLFTECDKATSFQMQKCLPMKMYTFLGKRCHVLTFIWHDIFYLEAQSTRQLIVMKCVYWDIQNFRKSWNNIWAFLDASLYQILRTLKHRLAFLVHVMM